MTKTEHLAHLNSFGEALDVVAVYLREQPDTTHARVVRECLAQLARDFLELSYALPPERRT